MAAERGNGLCRKKVEVVFFFIQTSKKTVNLARVTGSGETAGSRHMAMAAAAAATVAVKHNQNKQQLVNQSLPV